MKLACLPRFVWLGAASVFLSGCATSALWGEGTFARYHEPASPPNLKLFHSARCDDVLVHYDETYEGSGVVKPRAYWLRCNHEPAPNPHKPRFVSVKATRGLAPIPIVSADSAAPPGQTSTYAVVSTNAPDFVLYSGEANLGCYVLPVYRDRAGRVAQVLLTPLAVVADLTIVGGFLFLEAWASGGFQFSD